MYATRHLRRLPLRQAVPFTVALAACCCCGCSHENSRIATPPRVIVVAPVLNLSDSQDLDPLRITDLVASEFMSLEGTSVIPVNRTLAHLALRGKAVVETPEDAIELAQAFNADATIVTAITEYDPYDPPVLGLIVQWYGVARPRQRPSSFDPVAASRMASDHGLELSVSDPTAPHFQVQRVFNAADKQTLREIRDLAKQRDKDDSPYGWRKVLMSQELYVRYCTRALIMPIWLLAENNWVNVEPNEAKS